VPDLRLPGPPPAPDLGVVCTSCGEKRWPFAVVEPVAYVCRRCRDTSPEKRAAARAAGRKSAEARRKKRGAR